MGVAWSVERSVEMAWERRGMWCQNAKWDGAWNGRGMALGYEVRMGCGMLEHGTLGVRSFCQMTEFVSLSFFFLDGDVS